MAPTCSRTASLLVLASLALSEAFVAQPVARPAAARAAAAPRMLFGGGGKDGEEGGGLNMMETIKKAQQVGVKVKELQEELTNTEVEATSAEGGVTVVISGPQVPMSVVVTDDLLAKGPDAVSTAVSVAVKEAHTNSVNYAKSRMSELYKEIGLPVPEAPPA